MNSSLAVPAASLGPCYGSWLRDFMCKKDAYPTCPPTIHICRDDQPQPSCAKGKVSPGPGEKPLQSREPASRVFMNGPRLDVGPIESVERGPTQTGGGDQNGREEASPREQIEHALCSSRSCEGLGCDVEDHLVLAATLRWCTHRYAKAQTIVNCSRVRYKYREKRDR